MGIIPLTGGAGVSRIYTPVVQQVSAGIRKVADQLLGIETATVVSNLVEPRQTVIVLDSDASGQQVVANSLRGSLPRNTRVLCLSYPPNGLVILGFFPGSASSVPASHITVLGTGSGTFTTPTGIVLLGAVVETVGPGGAGGGAAATAAGEGSCGGGGGAGGYAKSWLTPAVLGVSQTYAIGAGGAGAVGAAGGDGGTARFGPVATPLVRATGGFGGGTGGASAVAGIPVPPGAGGVGTNGDLLITGGAGSIGVRSTVSRAGSGGSSALGGGARLATQDSAGVIGGNYGGGGSGANNDGAGTLAVAGGDGGPGAAIVTLYYQD